MIQEQRDMTPLKEVKKVWINCGGGLFHRKVITESITTSKTLSLSLIKRCNKTKALQSEVRIVALYPP